jgi:hypothetical protein
MSRGSFYNLVIGGESSRAYERMRQLAQAPVAEPMVGTTATWLGDMTLVPCSECRMSTRGMCSFHRNHPNVQVNPSQSQPVGWYCPGCKRYHAPTIASCPWPDGTW